MRRITPSANPPYEPIRRHHPLRCPSGKTPTRWVNPRARKHSTLPKFGFVVFVRHLIPVRGAYRDRHETRGEWRWTRAESHERLSRARRAQSRVRQNRVVLTPGVCASSLAIARRATGAIVHRSPGRARHKPSNHCAGKAGCLAAPVCRCASVLRAFSAQRTVGAQPALGLPCALCSRREPDGSKARARCAARMRRCVWPSLRAQ
jgi:hypothetical protein